MLALWRGRRMVTGAAVARHGNTTRGNPTAVSLRPRPPIWREAARPGRARSNGTAAMTDSQAQAADSACLKPRHPRIQPCPRLDTELGGYGTYDEHNCKQ